MPKINSKQTSKTVASKASFLLRDGRTSEKRNLLQEVLYHRLIRLEIAEVSQIR